MTAPEVNELVERWWPLAGGVARKWGTRFPWLAHDFESAAGYALWQLARKVSGETDPERGGRFAGLVRQAVRWAVIRRLEQERASNPGAFQSLPRAINPETGKARDPLTNAKGRERETGAALAAADELATLFRRAELSERYRDVVMRRLGHEEPREEIAADLGVSGTRVREMVTIAREKLRDVAEVG
ncbi:sigma-70 family RNA polymerase sigma factor [Gemmata sp. G18]|uniref:Sigma-70 family RNA polymerase sigma factor n=1 Tax=Gemmata palustris TaxID=2822762 RepID=A0ABS5BXG3_9BACT|nr:sigma-70 family RNA polymerase sigma factor [Gemmata palustris]MBP3958435.1 sigma-70 family RNA polymerase sigma factor [Gemmata palustris]